MTDVAQQESDPFATSLAGRRLGRYEVLARLASGGMAAVYVARASGVAGFERLFAIKVLHPHLAHEDEFITMFLDEARLAARIRHPNVVPTTDISDTRDAGFYLVMDYIEGDHLGALLQHAFRRGERLPAPVTLRILVDALEGLSAAHQLTNEHGEALNLVHRDVSPHNIMVSTDGVARITDFGVAKASVRLSTTEEGQFKGKLAYMAPEHAANGHSDQRSDLFAMAIILWESLTGRRLFRAENHAATLNKICLEPIPMPSSVDPNLASIDAILARGLARDADQRFQTAEEFAEAIELAAESLGGMANQRTVAKLVKALAEEKVTRDRDLIRAAVGELGSSEEASRSAPDVKSFAPPPEASEGRPPMPTEAQPESNPRQPDAHQPAPAPTEQQQEQLTVTSVEMPSSERVQTARAAAEAAAAKVAELDQLAELDPARDGMREKPSVGLWVGSALAAIATGVALTAALWSDDKPEPPATQVTSDPSDAPSDAPTGSAIEGTGADGQQNTTDVGTSADGNDAIAPVDDPAEGQDTAHTGNDEAQAQEAQTVEDAHRRDTSAAGDEEDPRHRPARWQRSHGGGARDRPRPGTADRVRPHLRVSPRPTGPGRAGNQASASDEDDLMLNPYR